MIKTIAKTVGILILGALSALVFEFFVFPYMLADSYFENFQFVKNFKEGKIIVNKTEQVYIQENSALEESIKNAQKSVVLVTTSKGLIRKFEALKPTLEKLKKKNVKIRIAAGVTKDNLSAIKELSKLAEIKHMEKPEARFVIVDGKELMFMAMHDDDVHPSYDIGIWVNTPYFAGALQNMFEPAWLKLEDASKAAVRVK